jgi:colicin import membrane protein
MKNQLAFRLAALSVMASLAACSTTLPPPDTSLPVAKSSSVEQATRKLAQVAVERAAIATAFAESEKICYAKFFVNNCLDDAKEKRRAALAYQNAVEDEAQYFRRKAEVDERDREVAKAIREFEADQARAAAVPPPPPREVTTPTVAPKATLAGRKASQDARVARRAAQEQAAAPRRAAKARAFEQRRLDAEQRQRDVAARLAEKAAKAEAGKK